jgi:hypothetical protein
MSKRGPRRLESSKACRRPVMSRDETENCARETKLSDASKAEEGDKQNANDSGALGGAYRSAHR